MKKEKIDISAVIDRDLLNVINEFGLSESFKSGQLTCPYCEKTLSFENIGAIKPTENSILLICDDYTCLTEAIKQ